MTVSRRLKEFLDENGISYEVLRHREVFTAQEVAAAQEVSGKLVAKTVLLVCENQYILAVLPAPYLVDIGKLGNAIGCKELRLASESEMGDLFPDVEVGAMAPFGNLYGLPIYVDEKLAEDEEIVFNAGTHVETIRMKYKDFERLAKPSILAFGRLA